MMEHHTAGTMRTIEFGYDDDDTRHDQLPSVEEVRTRAALQLARVDSMRSMGSTTRSQTTSSSSRSRTMRRQNSSPALFDSTTVPIGSDARRVKQNKFYVLFVAISALLFGGIIGLIVGVVEGRREILGAPPPTPPPSRKDEVIAWLGDQGYSHSSELADPTSWRYQAAVWVADFDTLRVPLPEEGEETFKFLQRYVMALIYYSMNGPNWDSDWKFLTGLSTCSWNEERGASDGRTYQIGCACNRVDRVTSVHIPGSSLMGTLPSEIALLTHLQFLALNHNHINGSLPEELEEMQELKYLALHWNQLTGRLPPWLGNLENLRVLGLGNNQLTGPIPTEFQLLKDIVTLGLDDNMLTGDLSNIQNLRQMKRMYLENNLFQHSVDTEFLIAMENLVELDLGSNVLTGTLPFHMLDYPALKILDLHGNMLGGGLPQILPHNKNLTFVSLHSNSFTGTLPSALSRLATVTHLDLAFNNITGPLPSTIGTMTNLKYLFLAGLGLDPGPIPSWIGSLSKLEDISLKATSRTGPIPDLFGSLSKLILLDLDDNSLSGTIPANLGSLTQLSYLLLNRNEGINGTVPQAIQAMESLEILLVDRTSVEGSLATICTQAAVPIIVGADCDGTTPEVACDCCTVCCSDSQASNTCLDKVYLGQLDPIWENSFQRLFYQFTNEVIFGAV